MQLSLCDAPFTRPDIGLADVAHGQYPARGETIDQRSCQVKGPEKVREHQIGGRTIRQTVIEVSNLELADVGDAHLVGVLAGEIDGDRRDVETDHLKSQSG